MRYSISQIKPVVSSLWNRAWHEKKLTYMVFIFLIEIPDKRTWQKITRLLSGRIPLWGDYPFLSLVSFAYAFIVDENVLESRYRRKKCQYKPYL